MPASTARVVPLLDLKAQIAPLREDLLSAMARVVESGVFILGGEVESFETELATTLAVGKAVGVSSGTDALLLALMALGIGPGDEVVTTPFSFFATSGSIVRLGARPVFADIDPDTFNLVPGKAAALCGPATKALLPVHLFGRPAECPDLGIPVVEDAAQAIGACPLRGVMSCLSFFPSKNLGALGDGGAVLCNEPALADRLLLLRSHGSRPKYIHPAVGGNFRLDALQAALLRVKLPHLGEWTAKRRANADRYRGWFASVAGIPPELQVPVDHPAHIYNQFVIRAPRRDDLRKYLAEKGVGSEIYYPLPLHLQPCFANLGYKQGSLPQSEKACKEVLALPIYPELREEDQSYVVEQIARFYS